MAMVPLPAEGQHTASVGTTSHPQYAGVHDAMRFGLRSIAAESQSSAVGAASHPLENRLGSWDETRDKMQLNMQRNLHGLASPLNKLMERKIVSYVCIHSAHHALRCRRCRTDKTLTTVTAQNPHYPAIGGGLTDMHLSILRGTDEGLDPQEYLPVRGNWEGIDMHAVMEKKHGI